MSDTESVDYLQPGFDPKSLTIPRLRSVLVAHNVPYSSSAKKAQLVEIFNEKIVPQSKKILADRARAKRSSMGIFDADSATSSGNPFENEHEALAPPPRPISSRRSRSPRKASARIKSEEPDLEPPMPPPAPSSPSKRSSRATSRRLQSPDTDTRPELDSGVVFGKTRRDVTPKLKSEESDGLFRRTSDVFTSDNPFQSGSSPAVEEKTPSNRRRTTSRGARSSSKGAYRKTDDYDLYDGDAHDTPSALAVPTPKPVRRKVSTPRYLTPEPAVVEAGEEFTPQEQLELAAEEAINGRDSALLARKSHEAKKTNKTTPISMLLIIVLGVYAGWYRQEKIAVGYCGVGQTVSSIPSEFDVPEWAQSVLPEQISVPQSMIDAVEPECEPCPAHAYCYSDYSVRCEQDYLLKPHPFSLGGVVPLPPTCEADGDKVRRVKAVADRAIEELRERTAKYECRAPIDEEGTIVDTPSMEEAELKQVISKKKSRKMSDQEFEDLWSSAIGEIKQREEVQVEIKEPSDSGAVPNTFLSSTSLARLPLTCAAKRSVRLGLARHRFQISVVVALIATALYGRARFLADRAAAAKVPNLVDQVLDRLAQQKERGYENDEEEAWLFLPNLRDDVLRSTHSLRQRERIWQRVKAVVEQNSNVRTSQREGRSGEVGRAWEWIGPTTGDSGGRRRKSGRISWGQDSKAEDSPIPAKEPALHQKWEEPRPVY
ncbi:Man1-Src1p-C-terminal domain-containing protein [Poronia punctata]|nr:Man1-Src1p-C-terminal domain-containing protein [Poronia punctata]